MYAHIIDLKNMAQHHLRYLLYIKFMHAVNNILCFEKVHFNIMD